jgi:hypothetical protein
MIASFSKNFLFIRTRKTASTSTEIVLARECSNEDIITPIGVDDELIRRHYGGLPRNFCEDRALEIHYQEALVGGNRSQITRWYRQVKKALKYQQHISAAELHQILPSDFWVNSLKFAVDRHPYEKVVSLAYWRARNRDLQDVALLHSVIDKLIEEKDYCNAPLYMINGKLAVDRLLKYENLRADLRDIAKSLNINIPDELPRAKGHYRLDRRPSTQILTAAQKLKIQTACAIEFELLNYEK